MSRCYFLIKVVLCFTLLLAAGCDSFAPYDSYMYDDKSLPLNKRVTFITLDNNPAMITKVDGMDVLDEKYVGKRASNNIRLYPNTVYTQPGIRVIEVIAIGDNKSLSKKIEVNALAGHVYKVTLDEKQQMFKVEAMFIILAESFD